jgi:hypothetical protein
LTQSGHSTVAHRAEPGAVEQEPKHRRAAWKKPAPKNPCGYGALYSQHTGQADQGSDFDFLAPLGTSTEPEIH